MSQTVFEVLFPLAERILGSDRAIDMVDLYEATEHELGRT